MVKIFAFFLALAYHAPLWVFFIGFLCVLLEES